MSDYNINNQINYNIDQELISASIVGDYESVQSLIEAGANLNYKDKSNNTALIYACSNGFTKIAKLLIDYDADIYLKNDTNYDPLTLACKYGHLEIVKLLLNNYANVNQVTNYGTPLMIACETGNLELIDLLFSYDVDADKFGYMSDGAYECSKKYSNTEEVSHRFIFNYKKQLASKGDPDSLWSLGINYEDGCGCIKDLNRAFECYKDAADKGSIKAQNSVAYCYKDGKGCALDRDKAYDYFKMAAENGCQDSIIKLRTDFKDYNFREVGCIIA
jgi:TPR repeat protein